MTWVKARCDTGSCVEAEFDDHFVHVRSTEEPGKEVKFAPSEWDAFITAVRNGAFDRPASTIGGGGDI